MVRREAEAVKSLKLSQSAFHNLLIYCSIEFNLENFILLKILWSIATENWIKREKTEAKIATTNKQISYLWIKPSNRSLTCKLLPICPEFAIWIWMPISAAGMHKSLNNHAINNNLVVFQWKNICTANEIIIDTK